MYGDDAGKKHCEKNRILFNLAFTAVHEPDREMDFSGSRQYYFQSTEIMQGSETKMLASYGSYRARKQRTLARNAVVEGFGFWTGRDVRLEFRPAEDNSGIRFFRTDIPDSLPIPARVEYRINRPRQTTLACKGIQVDMVEHVLAALRGLQIDNCDILTDSAEMPGFDGSAFPFFQAVRDAGTVEQTCYKPLRIVEKEHFFQLGNGTFRVQPSPTGKTIYEYRLVYDAIDGKSCPIPDQDFSLDFSVESFEKEIVSCRTFLLKSEAEFLLQQGLCQRVSPSDVLVYTENGPLENQLRFDNECARHKVLDMIGDFSLVDCDWIGEFSAYRTGHQQNADIIKQLLLETTRLEEVVDQGSFR